MTTYYPRDDVPIHLSEHDMLNRKQLAQRLAEAIQFASLPQVMGVEGDWGSGKTSLLQNLFWRIEKKLPRETTTMAASSATLIDQKDPLDDRAWRKFFTGAIKVKNEDYVLDENIRAVWFEAWRYQHEPEPVIALLHEIRAQLLQGDKWAQRSRRLWEKMKQGAEVFVQGLFASTNEAISSISAEVTMPVLGGPKLSAKMPDVGKHILAASAARDARMMAGPLQSELIRKNLDLAISLFLGDEDVESGTSSKRKRRLVIIIDDLDRCAPDAVCRLLESIKVHLDLPSCFFVLGLNRRHVETSLTSRLVDAFHAADNADKEKLLRARASDYVEKITTNLVRIPRPDPAFCVSLAMNCLSGLQWPKAMENLAPIDLKESIRSMLTFRHIVPLPSNPRRIKALCNQFQLALLNSTSLFESLAAQLTFAPPVPEPEIVIRKCLASIFVFAALRHFFPDVYRMIEGTPTFYGSLVAWCRDRNSVMEPEVAFIISRLNSVSQGITVQTGKGMQAVSSDQVKPTLLPDPPEGISFFIQELVACIGDLTEDEVKSYTSAA